jgi:hypothetical protein
MKPDERKFKATQRLFSTMVGNVAVMLNKLRLTPDDFEEDEEFFGAVWDIEEHLTFDYNEMLGSVWFENGKWNSEWQEHA